MSCRGTWVKCRRQSNAGVRGFAHCSLHLHYCPASRNEHPWDTYSTSFRRHCTSVRTGRWARVHIGNVLAEARLWTHPGVKQVALCPEPSSCGRSPLTTFFFSGKDGFETDWVFKKIHIGIRKGTNKTKQNNVAPNDMGKTNNKKCCNKICMHYLKHTIHWKPISFNKFSEV